MNNLQHGFTNFFQMLQVSKYKYWKCNRSYLTCR